MGEGREPVQIKPTAEIKNSQVLGEEDFFYLSQTIDGLSNVESDEVLADCALKRDNLDDVIYIYKFISNSEIFEFLSESTFEYLNEEENIEVCKIATLYKEILTSDAPSIFELTPFDINQEAIFIAYINKRIGGEIQEKKEGLHIAWKGINQKGHLFDFLLKNTRLKSHHFPKNLRSFGGIKVFQEGEVLKVGFFGDSEKKSEEQTPIYAPGILKNFKPEFEEIFKKKFPNMKVEVEF